MISYFILKRKNIIIIIIIIIESWLNPKKRHEIFIECTTAKHMLKRFKSRFIA